MKDKQIALSSTEPRIFLISAMLHCVSMTGLVFLRSSFGFGYLRPKSVFFAFSWAFMLYAIYAWIDGSVWREHRILIIFAMGSVVLYWVHFLIAWSREWRENGEHEQYSGTPHPVWLLRRVGNTPTTAFEANVRWWGEPAAMAILAAVLGLIFDEHGPARWLVVLACCLWSKEAFNRWFAIRQRKRQRDIFADTGDTIEPPTPSNLSSEPPQAARKVRIKRTRNPEA